MRIISGIARGRKLIPPDGMNTRPTLDRVKEAMFNIIQSKTPNAIAIDLYAGTGSLGLETISRYGEFCYLVEKDSETYKHLKENCNKLGFTGKCKCFNKSATDVLEDVKNDNIKFDLIFIDPPYLKEMIPPHIQYINDNNLLKQNGIIVTKIDSSEEICQGFGKIKCYDIRKYGNTTIVLYRIDEKI